MMLTPRAEEIIRVLIRFPQDSPVTTAIISEELHISIRSVQRELPLVEQWLSREGYRFVRKRSVGLTLDEPEERRRALAALLDANGAPAFSPDDRQERQSILLRELLFASEPLKSYYFTDKLGISDGTLASDLNQLEEWLSGYHLTLVRRQGLGLFLSGGETGRRQAVTSHLCSRAEEEKHDRSARDISEGRQKRPAESLPEEITEPVARLLDECEKNLRLSLSDSARLHLKLYLSYAVCRIREGHVIEEDEITRKDLAIEPEFPVADYLMKQLRQEFHLPILDNETRYLTVFLTGLRIWPPSRRDLTTRRDFDVHQLTLTLIRNVGAILDVDFNSDSKLAAELSMHIQPTIGRLRAGIRIENPLLEDFRSRYEEVYQACRTGCADLAELYELPDFPDSETGFITIYFAMALDRKAKLARRISVIIVCPTGIGSSRLLAENLRKAYPDLDIRGSMSAFDIDTEKLTKDGIDLVISTVRLDTPYRWIRTSPLLAKQDRMLLDAKFKLILSQKKKRPQAARQIPTAHPARTDVEYLSRLGAEIYHLLDHIRFGQAPVLKSREEIITYASSLFADTADMELHFYELMEARDRLADTYMKPFHALLLHGKSPLIAHPCFGYVHLEPPVYENARIILGAIVSFIPEGEAGKISAPIASEIIGALLERPELLKAMRDGDDELFTRLLEISLLKFYRTTASARLDLN